jgi:hypothetical protein
MRSDGFSTGSVLSYFELARGFEIHDAFNPLHFYAMQCVVNGSQSDFYDLLTIRYWLRSVYNRSDCKGSDWNATTVFIISPGTRRRNGTIRTLVVQPKTGGRRWTAIHSAIPSHTRL